MRAGDTIRCLGVFPHGTLDIIFARACISVHRRAHGRLPSISRCFGMSSVQLCWSSMAPFTFSLMPSCQQPELLEQLGDNKSYHLGLRLRTSGALKNSEFSTSPGFDPPICHALNTCANAIAFGCQILSQKDI